MFIDQVKIYVKGGMGGDGCHSFYKDIYNRRGVPDGGPGGDGGNVVVEASTHLATLLDLRYNQHYYAEEGGRGGSNTKKGRTGKDLIVKVPAGTIIKDQGTGLLIRDLAKVGDRVVVARGGAGGKGNKRKTDATPGELGEEKTLLLELKLVADAGLIGLPNAGKSTLISCISKSHSEIAPYPFTTKSPKLGAVQHYEDSFIAADMPGLIEGAHAGKGLGDRFLRHIERTLVLVHLVEMVPPDGSSPVDNYKKIEKELKLYGQGVYNKPRIIVASKMDITGAEKALAGFAKKIKKKNILAISAVKGEGLKKLVERIYKEIKNVKNKDKENNGQDRNESLDWLRE
ncbi:MAG: GTPase ObgE [Candidatus Omnitrophica bacterium]|nr:GTPase ObgE [Candidatus Omnitrophota bacterium]